MQDLTQINPAIARTVIRVELAKAGIAAFEGTLSGSSETRLSVLSSEAFSESRAPVVGMMSFANGASALFARRWSYWEVQLTKPLPQKAGRQFLSEFLQDMEVNGYTHGEEAQADGVSCYYVEDVRGLEALLARLFAAFGEGRAAEPVRLAHETDSWIVPGSFKMLPAPSNRTERDQLEFDGLVALGCDSEKPSARVSYFEQAAEIAERAFGVAENQQARSIRTLLQVAYEQEAQRLRGWLARFTSADADSIDYVDSPSKRTVVAELECILVKLSAVLAALGLQAEAQRVQAERDVIGAELAEMYRAMMRELGEKLEHAVGRPAFFYRSQLSSLEVRSAELLRRNAAAVA